MALVGHGLAVPRAARAPLLDAISQLAPDYQPWFSPLFEPASGEVESLLFTLQGCLGTAVIFYILGFYRGKKSAQAEQGKRHADHR